MKKITLALIALSVISSCGKDKSKDADQNNNVTILESVSESKNVDEIFVSLGNEAPKTLTNNGGTLSSDPTDQPNTALQFDSGTSHAVLDASALTVKDAFTVSVWFKPDEVEGDKFYPVVNRSVDGSVNAPYYQFLLGVRGKDYTSNPNTFIFWMSANNTLVTLGSLMSWTPGNWYNLVATFDGQNASLYVNGKLQARKAVEGTLSASDQPVFVAKHYQYDWSAPGTYADLQLFGFSLSDEEIQELSNQ